jgi:hypothetical protein
MNLSVIKSATALFTAILLLALSSCSGSDTQLSAVGAVPDGSRQIAVMNLKEIALANDAQQIAKNGSLTGEAEQALNMFIPNDLLRPLATLLGSNDQAVNTEQAVIFRLPNGYNGMILAVTGKINSDALSTYRDEAADFDDYTVYNINRRILAISDDFCVIAPDTDTVKKVGKNSEQYLASIEGVKDYLTANNDDDAQTIRTASIASDVFGKKMNGLWLCGSLRFSDDKAVVTAKAITPDGKVDQIGDRIAQPINPNIATFVPQGANLIIASGLQDGDGKLFGAEKITDHLFPSGVTLSTVGSSLIYARPAGTVNLLNILSENVWNIANAVEMTQNDGEEAVELFRKLGNSQLDPETGCYLIDAGAMNIAFGYVDNYFLQSINGQVTKGNSCGYEKDFQNARLLAILDIPNGSSLQQACGLPCGASLVLKVGNDNLNAALRLYGNKRPVLATINSMALVQQIFPYLMNLTTGSF